MVSKYVAATIAALNTTSVKWPDISILRKFVGNFGGIVVPELTNGFPNKVLFTPGYVTEPANVRAIIRQRYLDAGLSHFPLNLYNDTPIYRNFYPQWDDTQLNVYCSELLQDGIIPVGSAFADGSKVVKPVVSPDLVPIVFTGWENPSPIVLPQLDSNNLFWVAKQYFSKSLVYWHNPPGQDAPFVNPPDWGAVMVDGKWSDVNPQVWNYMVINSGCQGLLFQGQGWINNGNDSVANLNDFVVRLIQGNDGWPIADLVDFEEVVFYNTTMQGNPIITAQSIRQRVPQSTGYCNG